MKNEYDVIVVGGGINGLAPAAYLAKAGVDVAVFEARNEVGTNCDTEELLRPGVRANLHASAILPHASPCFDDLELERFGCNIVFNEWGCSYPFKDGTMFTHHNYDAEKTYEAWKKLSPKDAEAYRKIINYLGDYVIEIMQHLLYTQPNPASFGRLVEIINKCPGVPANWLSLTGYQMADALFEDYRIKISLIGIGIGVSLDPWLRGIGSMGFLLMTLQGLAFCWASSAKGGSHALPHSLNKCFLHYGGETYQGCAVEKIIVENGVAKGVVLSEHSAYPGRKVMAGKAVISDLTPVPTFLWLVGPEHLSPEVVAHLMQYDYEGQVLFTNFWLLDEPLKFKAFEWANREIDPNFESDLYFWNLGVDSFQDIHRLHSCLLEGELPDPPVVFGGCFRYTAVDPTQAPPGMHTVLTWADVPYTLCKWGGRKLDGPGDWDNIREEYGDRVEDYLAEFAPNIKTAKVDRYIHTPLDITRRNQSQLKGTWSGGPAHHSQFYLNRPFPGCGAPRTPIQKLYTTEVGLSRWTGLSGGYTAACAVAEDLGIREQPWWVSLPVVPYQKMLERRGLHWKAKF